jgi:hypothetical protein
MKILSIKGMVKLRENDGGEVMGSLSILISKLRRVNYLILLLFFLTACSEDKPYEITRTEIKVNELKDRIQMEFEYEIANYSDEDYYFTLVFPSYIQEGLITKVGVQKLTANGSIIGGTIVSVSKNGPEMTDETIEAIVNGELPFIEQI